MATIENFTISGTPGRGWLSALRSTMSTEINVTRNKIQTLAIILRAASKRSKRRFMMASGWLQQRKPMRGRRGTTVCRLSSSALGFPVTRKIDAGGLEGFDVGVDGFARLVGLIDLLKAPLWNVGERL